MRQFSEKLHKNDQQPCQHRSKMAQLPSA
jgi:hypothetical protein